MSCYSYKKQKGAVMIICLIFLCVFSALAISMSSFSDSNVQIADNQLKANRALESAHSGLEVMRFYLRPDSIYMPGTTASGDRFTVLANLLQDELQGVGNIPVAVDVDCIELGSQANPVTLEPHPAVLLLQQSNRLQMSMCSRWI